MKVANEGLGPQQEIQNFLTRVLNLQMHHRFQVGIKIHTLIDNSHTKLANHFSITQILQLKPFFLYHNKKTSTQVWISCRK